jgi:hypothetical protein
VSIRETRRRKEMVATTMRMYVRSGIDLTDELRLLTSRALFGSSFAGEEFRHGQKNVAHPLPWSSIRGSYIQIQSIQGGRAHGRFS